MRRSTSCRRRTSVAGPDDREAEIAVAVAAARRGLVSAAEIRWLATVVRHAVTAIGRTPAEVSIRVLDDEGIADLHERWLGVTGPTDVITFDLAAPGGSGLQGDIAVSVETARRVAAELGWSPRHELAYYAVHGLLHLAGEDDIAPDDRRRMRARERSVLAAVGLPRPPARRPRGRS